MTMVATEETASTAQRHSDGVLAGRVAIVTGGGRGLGAAIVEELATAGARVVAVDLRTDLLDEVAARAEAQGTEVHPVGLDITDDAAVGRAFGELIARHGAIDVLVNNAGVDYTLSIPEMTLEQFDRVVAVNLRAPFVLSKHALTHMAERGSGHIVNIVSTAAKRAWANASAYHATKWGLLGLSHSLHVEGRQQGVKVTAVIAGGMRTPFLLDRFPDLDPGLLQDPRNVAATVKYVLCQPEETVIPEITVIPMRETSWP
jgi:NAD(P)-dependent dehydrogenase (short-subunit alcohol dehydrogenase family)